MTERMRDAVAKLRSFNKYERASEMLDPKIKMAVLDLETAGLGSIHSNFHHIMEPSEMRRMAKKLGVPTSQIKEALSYKSSPIWEVGLHLPGQSTPPTSFVNPIDGKLEAGAETLMNDAKIKMASGKEVSLKKLFDHAQEGDISKDLLSKQFKAELMSSEKATLQHVVTKLKETNTTHLAGWNIGGFDMNNMVSRMKDLGIGDSDIKFMGNLKVVDYLDDAEDLVRVMTQPYEKVFGQYLDPSSGKGLASSPRFRKGFTQLSSVAKLFPGTEHSAHRAGTKGGDVAVTKHIGEQIEKFKSGDKGAMRNVMRGMNENIVDWYDNHVRLMAEDGMDTAFELGKGRQELLRIQKEVDTILSATGENHPLALRKAYGTTLDKLESLDPAKFPTGAELVENKKVEVAKLRDSRLWKDMTNELGDMASKATRNVFEAIENGLPKLKGAWDDIAKNITKKHVAGAALIGGVALAHSGFKRVGEEKYEGDFMDAGMLGMNESELRKAIMKAKGIEGFNAGIIDRNKRVGKWNSMSAGREVHEMIQRESGKMSEFVGVEVPVTDQELGIKGMVDLVVRQDGENIPVEIKTVETVDDLMALERPKDAHMSQHNFYSHAMGAQGGYIMYAARNDPSKRKTFYQPYSSGQLVGDVHKFRSTLTQAVKSDPSVQHYWKTHIQNMGWETPLGIRPQSRQGYGGRDSMKGNSMFGFPGGREQTFASKESPKISFKAGRSRSRIRDQSARTRFSGMGHPRTPIGGNFTVNPASRQSGST
jgi:hypothetical protein